MTRSEWMQAINKAAKLTQGEYSMFMIELQNFSHSEMGKPRGNGTWEDRFSKWKKQNNPIA